MKPFHVLFEPRPATRASERGQSEVLSVVMLLLIAMLGIAAVVAGGSTVLGEAQQTAEVSAAEHAFEAFDADMSAVALGQSDSRTTNLGLVTTDGEIRHRDSGWIRVDVYEEEGGATEVVNSTLGSVEYTSGQTTVAAQGGGVWRRDGDGSVMLSRPEFHVREKTLTLPIVSVDGDPALTDEIQITRTTSPDRKYPDPSAELLNPPDSGTVTITVQSDYYQAWGHFFEDETDAIVSYDHDRQIVSILFVVLPGQSTFDNGLIATSSTGEMTVGGTGAYVDSYDSSVGNYSQTNSADGEIQTAGSFLASGNAVVDGNVVANGSVELKGSSQINGDLQWGAAPEPDSSEKDQVSGTVTKSDGVRTVNPIDSFVANYTEQVHTTNDNDATPNITDNQLSLSGSSGELDAGTYYLHDLTLNGDSLVVNTTDGDVQIVVRDYVKLTSGGNITVEGDGTATVVVASENDTEVSPTGLGKKSVNLHVGKGSAVHVPDEVSTQFHVYGPRNFNATIAGSSGANNEAVLDGIIYAPAGTTGSGYVYIKQADLYGLAVTGNLTVGQYGAAHYDYYGLEGSTSIRSPYSELNTLHVTVHHATVVSN